MKKNLTLLTGLVFALTVLIAIGCSNKNGEPTDESSPEKVKIRIGTVRENGEKLIKMKDTNGKKATGDDLKYLITDCKRNTTKEVVWNINLFSGIREIIEINPITTTRIIFQNDPQIISSKRFILNLPDDLGSGEIQEKYEIKLRLRDTTILIDPHLRIPD